VKDFQDIPCLFTRSTAAGRTTAGTVEAISLDRGHSWIGINQNRINGWVEELLRADALKEMLPCGGAEILHEVREGSSRLDLCIRRGEQRTYLELKTPMRDLFLNSGTNLSRPPDPNYFERGIKHFYELARLAGEGNRTIVAVCFMYDAQDFHPQEQSEWNRNIREAVDYSRRQGVESWQINLKITDRRLSVRRLLRLW
jgi:DNA-binding sugar fermentation-stimulating protein